MVRGAVTRPPLIHSACSAPVVERTKGLTCAAACRLHEPPTLCGLNVICSKDEAPSLHLPRPCVLVPAETLGGIPF